MAKLGANQFSQRRRQIAPGIRISNWIKRQRESLPGSPREENDDPAPVVELPRQAFDYVPAWIGQHLVECLSRAARTIGRYNIGYQGSNTQHQYRRVQVRTTNPNPLEITYEQLLLSPPVGRTHSVASRQGARHLPKPSLLQDLS